MSSRKGVAAVAARMDSVVGLNPSLDLLGVVLVGTGTNSKQVHKVTAITSQQILVQTKCCSRCPSATQRPPRRRAAPTLALS